MSKKSKGMRFTYQYDKGSPKISIRLSSDVCLDEILESLASFLRAAGYVFDGNIETVNPEQVVLTKGTYEKV